MSRYLPALRILVTVLALIGAALVIRWLWNLYEVEPWTRDGRLRADVVEVAPDVSGLVAQVDVRDNQPVKQGQTLFVIDRARFRLALEQAKAAVATQQAALSEAQREVARNRKLGTLVSAEASEKAAAQVQQLQAALDQAKAGVDVAQLNLARAVVSAPESGRVTNMELHPGDYASAGHPVLALVDMATMHVDGYFEETKLPRIQIGDPVTIKVMGVAQPLQGHVASIAAGIEDRERGPGARMLPNVNPTFSWVRLAQRIPVRIAIDRVPKGVKLIAGRTATVIVHPKGAQP